MHYNSVFLNSLNSIDASWRQFLKGDVLDILEDIETKIIKDDTEYTPKAHHVLRFLQIPLHHVKVIILGQDPYPQNGVATGRAFEVGTLKSWNDRFTNISLKNIVRAIYQAYNNKYLKYNEIKSEIGSHFQLTSPGKIFAEWEKQGVLLLNTSFTCEIGKSNSHEKYWNPFTRLLLEFIAVSNQDIVWFLWGNNAKSIVSGIDIKRKFETMHPMMCYNRPDRPDDFLFGKINCFSKTKEMVNWLG